MAAVMARQGYDLQLTRYDEKGGRATFYTTGTHSPTSATGTGDYVRGLCGDELNLSRSNSHAAKVVLNITSYALVLQRVH
jgi:hypothetical protein